MRISGLSGTVLSRLLFLSLARRLALPQDVIFGLLVAVRDQAVQEATRAALWMLIGLGSLDLAVEVAGSLIIEVFVLVEVGCIQCQSNS